MDLRKPDGTSSWIPAFNKSIFALEVVLLSACVLTLFIVARNNHASGEWIFTDTTNSTGWSSDGWAFMLAIGNAVYSYAGIDCAAHVRMSVAYEFSANRT